MNLKLVYQKNGSNQTEGSVGVASKLDEKFRFASFYSNAFGQ